jgi:hypothetical protein
MDDGIAFKSALVAVVADGAVRGFQRRARRWGGREEGRRVGDISFGEFAGQLTKKFVTKMLVSFPSWGKTWRMMSQRQATGSL